MGILDDLYACIGFEWDAGNREKNWEKHRVSDEEAEQVFLNTPLVSRRDPGHENRSGCPAACGGEE